MGKENLDELVEVYVPPSVSEAFAEFANITIGNFEPQPVRITRRELREYKLIGHVRTTLVAGLLAYHVVSNWEYFNFKKDIEQILSLHLIVS